MVTRLGSRLGVAFGSLAIALGVALLGLVAVALVQPSAHTRAGSSPVVFETPPPAPTVAPAGTVSHGELTWLGATRGWRTFVPKRTDTRKRLPLLVLLHPAGGTADTFAGTTAMDSYAAAYGFATVAPSGAPDGTWNAGACCGVARDQGADDIGFVNAVITQTLSSQPVDPGQVYVAGASNGGMLAYALACRLSDRIQAVFSAGGAQTLGDCHPSRPVSVIEFHAASDATVPAAGGVDPNFARILTSFVPLQTTFTAWAGRDHCGAQRTVDAGKGEQLTFWFGCNDGTLLEVWMRTAGGGHEWPTGPGAPIDASDTIAKAIAKGSLVRQPGRPSADPLTRAIS